MTLHKLTAGEGYTYLTRQVAAHDATTRGFDDLGSYYSEKGEAPGVWMGRGLSGWAAAVPDFPIGEHVTEEQMKALFGEGRHPNADAIDRAAQLMGLSDRDVDAASRLGKPYLVHEAANMFHRRSAGAFRDYNTAQGLPADTPVPEDVRAAIRSRLATKMFVETFGREPADARELSGHLARISRQATTAVAGYDVTFSPVKSVSTLWAIAPREIAQVIEAAHHDAVKDTLSWLEDHATYTRVGSGGIAQVDVHGLIAAAFTHRDSRAGDPDLHTHVAISNKVQTLDGRWYALDGRPIFKNTVVASERYNTRLEALLIERLGVAFADRAGDDPTKRPVREIVGIDGDLPRAWSSRRAAIDVRRAELSAKFQADHGRPPTPKEAVALAQQANLETRQRKHQPRSYAEQRAAWRAEALTVLGGESPLHYFIRDALRGGRSAFTGRGLSRPKRPAVVHVTRRWVEQTADEVLRGRVDEDGRRVGGVQNERATWQENHIRAEAERHARTAGIRLKDLDSAVDHIVAEALSPARSILLEERDAITVAGAEPATLRRGDGTSVFTVAGAARYTSAEIIAAEEAIVAAGGRRDGRRVAPEVVDLALLESTANKVILNPGQVQLVRELATSGARVQLALAPAGTGKTTAMRVLARAWTHSGGTVIGLAPSAGAAAVLREEIDTDTDTLAKLIWHIQGREGTPPAWIDTIGPDTLVVIDESGMAGTPDLATAIDHITARGGSVRLVGDDQQLAAIGAGGALRDLAHEHGAVTLSQVMRFTHPAGHPQAGKPNHAEGAASLALRDGDPAAIAYYLDHGRVHVGDLSTVTNDAYTAWSADRAAGADPIMLAPTRELVAELNDRARTDRLAATETPLGREIALADTSRASAGDTIITRKNNRRIRLSATDYAKNGDRWRIDAVREDGALNVTHLRTGRHLTLPAGYVAQHVQLGYASTVHGAQGITADTCYTVATGEESRQLLYVAMTRGRHTNHLYLTTAGDGDPHSVITRDALLPPTAGDIYARVLARDASPVSATSQRRELTRPGIVLQATAARYHHALAVAAQDRLGPDRLALIDTAAEATIPGITRAEAYPTLRAHLALLAVDGHNPADILTSVTTGTATSQFTGRGLADARDVAAVLDWRLDPSGHHSAGTGPLPWLTGIPTALATDPDWGSYLLARAGLVIDLRATVAEQARAWTPTSAPTWAIPLVDRDPDLVADLAVWRATHSVEDTDRRPTGAAQPAAAEARAQRDLDQRITRLLGDPHAATATWAPLATSIDPRLTTDPYWATLADRLTAVERAGINIAALTRAVAAERPLPDEQPAAALWWRLAGHLSPAAMSATDHSESDTLRPDWTPALADIVGAPAAIRIMADPAWPSLVAAVTTATSLPGHRGWAPHQVLATAYDLLLGGQPDDEPLRPDELASALVWRIGMLTDHTDPLTTHPTETQHPDDEPAADDEPAPPDDLGEDTDPRGRPTAELIATATEATPHHDSDWLASLLADEPAPDPDNDPPAVPRSQPPGVDTEFDDWGIGDPIADVLDALDRAEQQRFDAEENRAHFWATADVPRERLVELNALAEDFFTRHYTDTWAADYVRDRLGTDFRDDPRVSVGYAPNTWTALTNHLRRQGATDTEILGAGLGVRSSTGNIIDRFRDRLVFPIKAVTPTTDAATYAKLERVDTIETHGFIGRRNPTKTDEDNAGPKYLNTADTDLFTKGHELYGLADNAAALAADATPVLVEGPMDALAVTLAGANADGTASYVGVAPLGTAFTDTQADALRPYISTRPHRGGQPDRAPIIVATDNDRAGQQAAHRAFWQLVARGEDPRHLVVAHGKDPAELLQTHGPDVLRTALQDAVPLAEQIIADRTAVNADRLDTIEGRIHATRRAADVIGARPATTWLDGATTIADQIGVAPQTAINEVLDAGHAWTEDPRGLARRRLTERLPEAAPTRSATPSDPTARWTTLATRLTHLDVAADPHWPVLAEHLSRAEDTGYDVANRLVVLLANQPLPAHHALRDLDLRLVTDWPGCLPPTGPAAQRDNHDQQERAAQRRKAVADEHTAHDQLRPPARGASTPSPTPTTPPAPPQPPDRPGPRRGGPARP
jgi:DNA primase catalytic core